MIIKTLKNLFNIASKEDVRNLQDNVNQLNSLLSREKTQLRQMVGEAIVECLKNYPDDDDTFNHLYFTDYNRNLLLRHITSTIDEKVEAFKPSIYSLVEEDIKAQVNPEEFIDKVVTRIKNKQLHT